MSFPVYLEHIQDALNRILSTGDAGLVEFQAESRSATMGFIAGVLHYRDGSELHFREYVDTTQSRPRLMYAYHFQDGEKQLKFRYDNAAHRPALLEPEHKHTVDGVEISRAPTLQEVLDEIDTEHPI